MSLFTSILQGLQKKIDAHTAYKKDVVEVIHDVLNISLTPESVISLKDGILTLSLTPTIRMALILKKDEIIRNLVAKGVQISSIR